MHQQSDSGIMLTVEGLAERWQVNVKTIYSMIDKEQIPALRLGRSLRIPLKVVRTLEQCGMSGKR